MAACNILDLCPTAIEDPSDPNTILFWDTNDPDTVVRISRASWDQHLIDIKGGKYDKV